MNKWMITWFSSVFFYILLSELKGKTTTFCASINVAPRPSHFSEKKMFLCNAYILNKGGSLERKTFGAQSETRLNHTFILLSYNQTKKNVKSIDWNTFCQIFFRVGSPQSENLNVFSKVFFKLTFRYMILAAKSIHCAWWLR